MSCLSSVILCCIAGWRLFNVLSLPITSHLVAWSGLSLSPSPTAEVLLDLAYCDCSPAGRELCFVGALLSLSWSKNNVCKTSEVEYLWLVFVQQVRVGCICIDGHSQQSVYHYVRIPTSHALNFSLKTAEHINCWIQTDNDVCTQPRQATSLVCFWFQ